LIAPGAPSTSSLASFKPNPVNSLTSLTTASLEAPADLRITSNSVCASSASPPPAAGPATETAAAAGSIPYSFFKISANSERLLLISLLIFLRNLLNLPFFYFLL